MSETQMASTTLNKDMSGGNSPFYMPMGNNISDLEPDKNFFKQDTNTATLYNDPIFVIWNEIDNRTLKEATKLFVKENITKPAQKMMKTFGQGQKRKVPQRKSDAVFSKNSR